MEDDINCKCLPNAGKIADEIQNIASSTRLTRMEEDADYITGMLFVIQESGFVEEFDEFKELLDSAKKTDRERFGAAAHRAAEKIAKLECKPE